MPRSSFQKLKIIYIMEYLLKNSDEDHAVTTSQIIAYLKSHDITAERKTIYSDIEALRDFGLDIIQVSEGNNHGYYVASRDFELPELKLLVDSVQSSKFITHKKTLSLIKKIEKLASIHSAQLLNRQVFVKNRIKTMNESIYYNVDEIHNGISSNRKIRFLYFEYNVAKERVYRHDGAYYVVSPFAMTWDDENYYMVAFDSAAGIIKHYRVDKMEKITVLDEERDGQEAYEALDVVRLCPQDIWYVHRRGSQGPSPFRKSSRGRRTRPSRAGCDLSPGWRRSLYSMDRCDRQPAVLCMALRISDGSKGHWT